MSIVGRDQWIRDGDGFFWRGYRIRREPTRHSGWEIDVPDAVDRAVPEPSFFALHPRSLDRAFEIADGIEEERIKHMKLRTYLVLGVLSLVIVASAAYSFASWFEYLLWVALLGIAAEALLRAATLLFWDEWGWLGPSLEFDEANLLDRFLARVANRMREKSTPEEQPRIRVARSTAALIRCDGSRASHRRTGFARHDRTGPPPGRAPASGRTRRPPATR